MFGTTNANGYTTLNSYLTSSDYQNKEGFRTIYTNSSGYSTVNQWEDTGTYYEWENFRYLTFIVSADSGTSTGVVPYTISTAGLDAGSTSVKVGATWNTFIIRGTGNNYIRIQLYDELDEQFGEEYYMMFKILTNSGTMKIYKIYASGYVA